MHNRVVDGAGPDEQDVLVQVAAVSEILRRVGRNHILLPVDLNLAATAERLHQIQPELVINLVESLDGSGRLIYLAPALLEHLRLPFTGASAATMFLTSNKRLAKRWMMAHGLPAPADATGCAVTNSCEDPWIVKSVWEDASLGLDDESVVLGRAAARNLIGERIARHGGEWFAEQFIAGREFNVSLLADVEKPLVLPVAEIQFIDFPPTKPRLVGYQAKWRPGSFEYQHTLRRFLTESEEVTLTTRLRDMSQRCWEIFCLRGYARVDFRVDEQGQPWVLEVNANPCLSPDAGFAAALAAAGICLEEALGRIMVDSSEVAGARIAPTVS